MKHLILTILLTVSFIGYTYSVEYSWSEEKGEDAPSSFALLYGQVLSIYLFLNQTDPMSHIKPHSAVSLLEEANESHQRLFDYGINPKHHTVAEVPHP